MQRTFVVLIVLLCSYQVLAGVENCKRLLGELGNSRRDFVYCATEYSAPFHICSNCAIQYKDMEKHYNMITHIENCSKMYINADRINVLSTTQTVLNGLWQRAFCDNCEGNEHFFMLADDLNSCTSFNSEPCTACLQQYKDLNTFFKDIEKNCSGHVCFDLQDGMNRTRLNWSKELKCCRREVQRTAFVCSAAIIALIPFICFYGGVYMLARRREANHGMLHEQEPELNAPSTSALITAAILSTPRPETPPAETLAREQKLRNLLNNASGDTDSDDDSALPIIKPKTR